MNIALVYSTMAPIILPFALLYFLIAWITHKYNFVFVFAKHTHSGVRNTVIGINRTFAGLFVYQLTMGGVFSAKSFHIGGIVCLILSGISLGFRIWLERKYWRVGKYLPLIECPADQGEIREEELAGYQHPALAPLQEATNDPEYGGVWPLPLEEGDGIRLEPIGT